MVSVGMPGKDRLRRRKYPNGMSLNARAFWAFAFTVLAVIVIIKFGMLISDLKPPTPM